MRRGRSRAFGDPLFLSCQKKWAKKMRWKRIGLYRKPQNEPVEERCGQHTEVFLQS